MLPQLRVIDDVRAGRLREVLRAYRAPAMPGYIVYPSRRHLAPRTRAVIDFLLSRRRMLAQKVELLCLHDVEYRILHYLAELSKLVKPLDNGEGYPLPITQLELADLIGATRETTSTTLNQLERRGLLKLSRRLLTISSPLTLLSAANAKQVESHANNHVEKKDSLSAV